MRPDDDHCCFDDWVPAWRTQLRTKEVARRVTRALLDALDGVGIAGRSILDLGCGVGDLSVASVGRGAASAQGYDLSKKAIAEARALASERGVSDRAAFEVGDAAQAELPVADVVVLNRVFCCYPHVDALLERSVTAARSVYAYTIPRSRGLVGAFERVSIALGNAYYRLRPKKYGGFQVYLHDVDAIDARVRSAGFEPVRRSRIRLTWELAIYAR